MDFTIPLPPFSFSPGLKPVSSNNIYIIVSVSGGFVILLAIIVIVIIIAVLYCRRKLKSRKRGKPYSLKVYADNFTQWESRDYLTDPSNVTEDTIL